MLTLEYAKNPVYENSDGTSIYVDVKWAEFNEEHPFSATSKDVEPHGIDLYNRVKSGEFGAIAPYVPPVQPESQGTQTI